MICYEIDKTYLIPTGDASFMEGKLIQITQIKDKERIYVFQLESGDKIRLTAGFLIKNNVKEK